MVLEKRLMVVMLALICLTSAFVAAGFDGRRSKSSVVLAATDYPSNSVWIDPPVVNITDAQVGRTFRVIVWVQNASNIAAWQVYMEYNDSIINVTQWIEPKTDSHYIFYGKTTAAIPAPPDAGYHADDVGKAHILVAASLFPASPEQAPSNGTGILCTIEFKITQVPPKGEQLSCLLDINSTDTFMLDPDASEVQNVTKYNATVFIELGVEQTGFLGLDWWVWATIAVIIVVLVAGIVLVWRRRK